MSELQLHEGLGSFVFSDIAAPTGALRVFFFCPKSMLRDARIVVAMHGFDRAASEFRDVLVGQAGRGGQIILVPEFDATQFPDHCSKVAERLGTPFGWKLEIVPGAGHVDQDIYDRAAINLADR